VKFVARQDPILPLGTPMARRFGGKGGFQNRPYETDSNFAPLQ
jgi:hypothetical protein